MIKLGAPHDVKVREAPLAVLLVHVCVCVCLSVWVLQEPQSNCKLEEKFLAALAARRHGLNA